MKTTIEILEGFKKYTFYFAPHSGALKEIVDNELVRITYEDGTKEYKLSKKKDARNASMNEIVPGVMVVKTNPPFDQETRNLFIWKTLFIPILFTILGFTLSIVSALSFSSLFETVYSSSIFTLFVGYIYLYIKNDLEEPIKNSLLLLFILGIVSVSLIGAFLGYFSKGLMTNTMLNIYWFLVLIELVLKSVKIILAKNIQYWKYFVESNDKTRGSEFYMITPKGMKK